MQMSFSEISKFLSFSFPFSFLFLYFVHHSSIQRKSTFNWLKLLRHLTQSYHREIQVNLIKANKTKIWKLLCLHTAPGQPKLREADGEESEIVEGRIRIEKFDDDEQEGEVVGEEEEGEEEGGEVEEEG